MVSSTLPLPIRGYGRGINISWIEELNRIASDGIYPDITFLLDISPFLIRGRTGKKDRIENERILKPVPAVFGLHS